ncbi:MAG TPA: aminomethyl-transferring glycine dehydrogenase subunit GcvPB [Anaerovoracaceae bacterium]|nr:aminomethyl-transferring glycine dehydrogenase subunit GcvPB [Anaerovoracaceae bacterium]
MIKRESLIFEMSVPGRKAYSLPACDVPEKDPGSMIPPEFLREKSPGLPEVSEVDAVRHFTGLSRMNHGVDSGFYPLGSCTMKYNPKINEDISKYGGFSRVHPYQPEKTAQGCLEILYSMDKMLAEIAGMERVSLQPAAGAHGEMTGLMIIKAYHEHRGDTKRRKIVVPDSSHGTNPASAAVVGFDVVEVKSNERGGVDTEALKAVMSDEVAGLMLTNPSTLGLFEENILKISDIVHEAGGLLYYDGANMNAIMGITRPGDMGFDVVHLNLHKTFSTPHGGGGPGSGPVGVKKDLVPFLPRPVVEFTGNEYFMDYNRPLSIGRIKSFYGNFAVAVKAFAYIRSLGAEGLREASENAVLNANYIRARLQDDYHLPYGGVCMHEVVFSAQKQTGFGVSALDIAKRLIDFGYHPPTIYFPLIVKEAMMIEPTETESKETLDAFIEAMKQIAKEAEIDPEMVKSAPHHTVVLRLDETRAARNPVLKYTPLCGE